MAGAGAPEKGSDKKQDAADNATPVQKRLAELHEAELDSGSKK